MNLWVIEQKRTGSSHNDWAPYSPVKVYRSQARAIDGITRLANNRFWDYRVAEYVRKEL